jgi:hypothetical protein
MKVSGVVQVKMVSNGSLCLRYRFIGLEVDLFIFDAVPEAFDKDVVSPSAFAIHADSGILLLESPSKGLTGELTALIGIEDLGRTILGERLIQS